MNKTLIGVAVALLVGAGLGLAASGAFQDTLAVIKSEIVPSTTSVSNQTASLSGTITLNVGKLEAGKHYNFDDVYGETYLYTGSGGNFTFSLTYNESAFQYVKVEVEISGDHGDYYVDTEFYLDTGTPVFVITLPADIKVEIEVELKEITVSPNATLGPQEIYVQIAGP